MLHLPRCTSPYVPSLCTLSSVPPPLYLFSVFTPHTCPSLPVPPNLPLTTFSSLFPSLYSPFSLLYLPSLPPPLYHHLPTSSSLPPTLYVQFSTSSFLPCSLYLVLANVPSVFPLFPLKFSASLS